MFLVVTTLQQLYGGTTVYFRIGDGDTPFCFEGDGLYDAWWFVVFESDFVMCCY